MTKIAYISKNFKDTSLDLICKVNDIISEYNKKGYELTLRQVYYQLVARDVIANNERSYKNLGNLISDGRLAGLIDWNAIIDRTRNLAGNQHWGSPSEIIDAVAYSYKIDKWQGQENYVEVWVEKDALVGVVGRACNELDIKYFSCRGYVSQSEMWQAGMRLKKIREGGRRPVLLHLGDHDPSGIDMSRDIQDRLYLFGADVSFKRIALNMPQINMYNPPPNPTKLTDTRATDYINEFGHECWELDALKPEVIDQLIKTNVEPLIDSELYAEMKDREALEKELLGEVSNNWEEISDQYK